MVLGLAAGVPRHRTAWYCTRVVARGPKTQNDDGSGALCVFNFENLHCNH